MNAYIPADTTLIRQGKYLYSGSLLFADISGFTELTERLALNGKKGTEDLTEILNRYFHVMFGIVREQGGTVISSAGDSLLVRFPEGIDPGICSGLMMTEMKKFENLTTDAGRCRLGIKIIIGFGAWAEFAVGSEESAHIFLTGDIIERMAAAEDEAESGETISVRSDETISLNDYAMPDLPDSAFYIPATVNLQGEHRSITAVFVNITGYDSKEPPHNRIQELYRNITIISFRNNGVVQMVDNILSGGSRLFILFGAPRSYGNDLLHAVQSSLEIMRFVEEQGVFGARIGIEEGYAFAGVIGDSSTRKYTVIGDVVNTAARLADSADPGSIAVSDRVFRMSRNQYRYTDLPSTVLKGKENPVRCYSPIAKRIDQVDRFPFVGREEELSSLLSHIEGTNSVILIEGGAGIGKTSLLRKLSQRIQGLGYTVNSGAAPENGESDDLFKSLIGNMAGMLEDDSANTRSERLHSLINGLDDPLRILSKREAFLGRMLFSITYPDSDYESLPPKLRRDNLLDGICGIFRSLSGKKCVILDDLHYCSDEDLKAVEYIISHLLAHPGMDISFVLSRRQDERELFSEGDIPLKTISLEGLGNAASEELMLEILNGIPLERDIEDLISKRARGNPFYLMQFLLYLVEEGLIMQAGESWVKTELYSDEKLPGNVFSMIMARIDRLESQAKESLRIGSVAGFRFNEEIVKRVLNRDVHTNLIDCTAAGLTYQPSLKDLEFVFSHTLIKDVSYDSILRRRRKEIHGAIGLILEEMYPDRIEALCPLLASHFRIAENWDRALDYSIRAGEKAYSEYRNLNAIRRYQDAVEILENHVDDESERLAGCYNSIGTIHDRIGEYDTALEFYEKALKGTTSIALFGSASIAKADILFTRGEVETSMKLLDETEEKLLKDSGDNDLLFVRIDCFRAWSYCVMGNIDLAREKASKAEKLVESISSCSAGELAHQKGLTYNTIATVNWADGDYREAREYYMKALELAQKHNMKREAAVTYGNIGLVSGKMGDYTEAITAFNRQLITSREIGDKLISLTSYGSLSSAYSSTGSFETALDAAEKYKLLSEELPALHDILLSNYQLGLIKLVKGEPEQARELAEASMELARKSSFEREEACSLALMSLISLEEGEDTETAEELLGQAETLSRKVHAKSLLLDTLIVEADLHLKNDRPDAVGELLREASELAREMGVSSGTAKVHAITGRLEFFRGNHSIGMDELDKAVALFDRLCMKPALADTLNSYCGLLVPGESLSPKLKDKSGAMSARIIELEREMGIRVRNRSAMLLMI